MKKKKANIVKKPVYYKIFLRKLLTYGIIALCVGGIGTMIVMSFYDIYMNSELNAFAGDAQEHINQEYDEYCASLTQKETELEDIEYTEGVSLYRDLSREEKLEQFYRKVSFNAYRPWNRLAFAMMDGETHKVLTESPYYTLFMFVHEKEEDRDDDGEEVQAVLYTCKDENITKEVIKAYNLATERSEAVDVYMEDCYIKGTTFVPGKIKVTAGPYSEDISPGMILCELDFTPEEVSGYTHIIKGENDTNLSLLGPIWFDDLYLEMDETMDAFVADEKWKKDFEDADGMAWSSRKEGSSLQYEVTKLYLGVGEEQIEYWLLIASRYSLWEDWTKEVCIVYGAMALVTLLGVLISSNTAYMKQKSFYEMDQYRRDMTNTMAHDLKSPLMVISGFAENLLEQDLADKPRHYTNGIIENVQYMNQLIEKVLELSKVEDANYRLQKEKLDLREISEDLVKNYTVQLEKRGLEIQISGEYTVEADKLCMTQVIDNLISNAVKYSIEGSVIEIHLDDKGYEISNASEVDFDMDVMDLLKPFIKGDNSRSGKMGSGIGLTIAKNLLEQHRYNLELDYKDGVFVARIIW